jgi:hypothetical protein
MIVTVAQTYPVQPLSSFGCSNFFRKDLDTFFTRGSAQVSVNMLQNWFKYFF